MVMEAAQKKNYITWFSIRFPTKLLSSLLSWFCFFSQPWGRRSDSSYSLTERNLQFMDVKASKRKYSHYRTIPNLYCSQKDLPKTLWNSHDPPQWKTGDALWGLLRWWIWLGRFPVIDQKIPVLRCNAFRSYYWLALDLVPIGLPKDLPLEIFCYSFGALLAADC